MEKFNDICLENRPKNIVTTDGGYIPGCTVWIFGDENSVENDLKGRFEIIEK